MDTGDVIITLVFILMFSFGVAILMYNVGKEAGCHVHEFVVVKVECIHCQRRESRTKREIVERKVNVAPPSSQ